MKKFLPLAVIPVLVTVLSPGQAQAITTLADNGNAGETLSTATVIPPGPVLLNAISGTISPTANYANVFQIYLTSSAPFSATTVGGADFDTQLFLFDANGIGISTNDDASGTKQSTLPSFTPTTPSKYYLAISPFDYNPVSSQGNIFPVLSDFRAEETVPSIFGPTGTGGSSPLSGFDGAILLSDPQSYSIALTGVQTNAPTAGPNVEPVPEPASVLGTLMFGAWGIGSLLKHKKNQQA